MPYRCDKLQWSSRLCSKSMLSKFKREERKIGGREGEKEGEAEREQQGKKGRKDLQTYFHSPLKIGETQ